jgi:hypothetical protein
MGTEPLFDSLAVTVTPFVTTDEVAWTGGDGKPRCARHPYVCLIRATAIGLRFPGHLCARCMRELADGD